MFIMEGFFVMIVTLTVENMKSEKVRWKILIL